MDLKKTTTDNGHYHIIYIRDDGSAIMSNADDGHIHIIEPKTNPSTGEIYYYITPEEDHSHEVVEIELDLDKEDKIYQKNDDLVYEGGVLLNQAIEIEKDFRRRGRRCSDFYVGKQYKQSDIDKLNEDQRAAIVVNEVMPIVHALSGHQRQNRTDIKTFPIEKADPRGAEIADILIKFILEKANYAQHESNAFIDQVVVGRGLIDVYVDFFDNIEGDIRAVKFKWDDIFFGPHENEDLSDLEYLIKTKWYSFSKIKSLYPDLSDDIDILTKNLPIPDDSIRSKLPGDPYKNPDNILSSAYVNGESLVDIEKKNIRLLELWKKVYKEYKILVNIEDEENHFVYEKSKYLSRKDLNLAKRIPGMELRSVPFWQMQIITFVGGKVVDKRIAPLKDFNVIAIYASKEYGYIQGKVEPLIDLQEEINKRHSQAIDVINRANNDVIFYDDETFSDDNERKKFNKNANKPGFTAQLRDINRKVPVKWERARFPSELVNMRELASAKMKEISGVTPEVLGQESNAKSGVAIARRLRQGLITNDYLFDNLSIAKKRLGKILIKIIQDTFTVDRIMKVLHNQNAKEPFQMQDASGQKVNFSDIDESFVREFLQNIDFSDYDVAISESANSPTKNLDRFTTISEMMSNGSFNPITIDLMKSAGLISPSDAEKYNQMLQQQQQASIQEKQLDNQSQAERTLIAQGLDPRTMQPLPGKQ